MDRVRPVRLFDVSDLPPAERPTLVIRAISSTEFLDHVHLMLEKMMAMFCLRNPEDYP